MSQKDCNFLSPSFKCCFRFLVSQRDTYLDRDIGVDCILKAEGKGEVQYSFFTASYDQLHLFEVFYTHVCYLD